MNPLLDHLRRYADNIAVHTDSQQLSYAELADRVQTAAAALGDSRRLVLLETRNDVDTLVHYLAALAGRHVVLPVPAGRDHDALLHTYDPDTVISDGVVAHRHGTGTHRLHEDLAMVMSTSGSTGSPKLVRLSYTNLTSNARAIAEYLGIDETDIAATTLPLSYCYGLSVVNSHLIRGAGLILTDLSVTDEQFWELFRRHRGTSFAGVPYTFDLLDRAGFATMDLPHLRYVTQAGGRMPPERVRQFAGYARDGGWKLFVMYGATEATARMAYLAPELALSRPEAIGTPIPGGSFSIEPVDGLTDVGELVYRGPNVMMGYAHGPADLELGKTVDSLHTGDLARRAADGLFEIVGRTSRFVKMFGLRIDLQRVESALRAEGIIAFCADDDDRLVVAATNSAAQDVARVAADTAGIPASAVCAVVTDELPLLPSGKPDYPGVRALARADAEDDEPVAGVRELFADVLQLDPATIDPEATFVDLGGNSLTYVALSVRLERLLGRLPAQWQQLPLRELEALAAAPPRRRRWFWAATLDTSVALRAIAIVLIVGSHAELFELWGGAHVLLGVAGYNFGRFCLTAKPQAERVRHLRNTIAWIAVPTVLWVAVALVITDHYTWTNLLLANKILGPFDSMTAGRLWFVEILVWTLVALLALFCIPALDRAERRYPFAIPLGFLAFGLALRYDVPGLDPGTQAWFSMVTFWLFAWGWAAAKATTVPQRVLLTAVLAVALYGYYDDPSRTLIVFTGLLLTLWLPAIRCPAAFTTVAGLLAEASLYTYLVHYQVYALFPGRPLIGVLASLVVGVLITQLMTVARRRVHSRADAVNRPSVPAPR